jgi:Ciliary BBSome complex subunit 1
MLHSDISTFLHLSIYLIVFMCMMNLHLSLKLDYFTLITILWRFALSSSVPSLLSLTLSSSRLFTKPFHSLWYFFLIYFSPHSFLFLLELLSMDSNSQARSNYIQEMKNVAYQQLTLITSMETLKKDSDDMDALTLLVIGTYVRTVLPLTVQTRSFIIDSFMLFIIF